MTQPSDPAVGIARCNACGADFQSGEPFCGQCGEPISCLTCGQAFEEGTRFCPSCGRPKTTDFMSSGGDPTETTSVWDLVQAKLRRATLGEFEIKGEIGRGGMAAVYLAHEVALNRKVAIKVMSPALLMGTGMAARFRQEAITVANLNHQNIITIHAVRQFEDLQYFVMQFVEGCSLETIVKQSGPLSIPIVRALLFQVGSALAHAHHQGVVHRDIKPGNILTGMRGQALVTDFGIAKVMESPSNTQTGTVVGTPAYMSPEQCRIGEVTWRSDQYSLGIVAYEMVAGKVPFDGPTLYTESARVPAAYGRGASGSGAVTPRLIGIEPPVAGNPSFTLALADGLGGAPALLLLDVLPDTSGRVLLGVPMQVAGTGAIQFVPLGQLRDAGAGEGHWSLGIPLPADPALNGVSLYFQGVVADSGASQGLAATAGLRVTFFAAR